MRSDGLINDLPLTGHRVLDTCDIELAGRTVGQRVVPHRLTPLTPDRRLRVVHHHVALAGITLGVLYYGGAAEFVARRGLEKVYLVLVPLSGRLVFRCAGDSLQATPRTGVIVNPGDWMSMSWKSSVAMLAILLEQAFLEERVTVSAHPLTSGTPHFERRLDLTEGMDRAWLTQIWAIVRDLEERDGWSTNPLLARRWAELLLDGMLLGHSHDGGMPKSASGVPQVLQALVQRIHERPDLPWKTADIARTAGWSARAVQKRFSKHFGTTPQAYIRNIRMARARAELCSSDPDATTVTEIARRWRFNELGRFAVEYRKRYGEVPSRTLRRI